VQAQTGLYSIGARPVSPKKTTGPSTLPANTSSDPPLLRSLQRYAYKRRRSAFRFPLMELNERVAFAVRICRSVSVQPRALQTLTSTK